MALSLLRNVKDTATKRAPNALFTSTDNSEAYLKSGTDTLPIPDNVR